MDGTTVYANNEAAAGRYNVTFMDNKSRVRLTRLFESPYLARKFVNKIKRSKKCTLISSPLFE